MNADSDFDEADGAAGSTRSPSQWPMGWGLMLVLGLAVYEITAQPRWGIAATCTKLIWSDLTTGRWWLQRDPWRQRGVCGVTLLVIRATAKYAFTVIAIGILMSLATDPAQLNRDEGFRFTIQVGGLALAFWMVSGFFVTILALLGRIHLWVDSSLTESRQADQFPPACRGRNQAIWLLLGSRLAEFVVGTCFIAVMAARVGATIPMGIAAMVVGVVSILSAQVIVTRRICARTPEEGFPEIAALPRDTDE